MSWVCRKWYNLLRLTFIYIFYTLFYLLNSSYLHLFNSRSKQRTISFYKQIIYFGYSGWEVSILIIFYLICIENWLHLYRKLHNCWCLSRVSICLFILKIQLALIVCDITCSPPKIYFFEKFKYQSENHKLRAKCQVEKT